MKQQEEHSRSMTFAQEYMQSLGLPEPVPPDLNAVDWPDNLAEVPDEELSHHMAYWTAMMAYIGDHVAMADAERKVFELQEESLIAKCTLAYIAQEHDRIRAQEEAGEKISATEKTARTGYTYHRTKALMHDDVQTTRALYLKYYTLWKLLTVRLKDYEQKYTSVSREITRRENLRLGQRRSA